MADFSTDTPLAGATPDGASAAGSCRTRRRALPLSPGAQRPSELLTAFFVSAIGFMVAGGVVAALHAAGLLGWWGRWLALHLLLLGGVSQLVLGTAQFFSTAYLATDPPSRSFVRGLLGLWAAGTLLVAIAVPARIPALSDAGALLLLGGLAIFWTALRRLERRSLRTARWAIRWYYACAAFLVVGALIGMLIARGTTWSHGSLLGAHVALNLAGWLGTAIVGTLHTFYPSLTQSRLVHERLQGATFTAWTLGVSALAAGAAFDVGPVGALGWLLLTVAALLLSVNLAASWRSAERPLGFALAPRLVGAAQIFLVAGLFTSLAMQLDEGLGATPDGRWRAALAVLLIAGWIGMTVAGSLLHLLSVLYRVRHLGAAMPRPRPRLDRAQTAAPALAIAALALSYAPGAEALRLPAAVLALVSAAPVAVRILLLATPRRAQA